MFNAIQRISFLLGVITAVNTANSTPSQAQEWDCHEPGYSDCIKACKPTDECKDACKQGWCSKTQKGFKLDHQEM